MLQIPHRYYVRKADGGNVNRKFETYHIATKLLLICYGAIRDICGTIYIRHLAAHLLHD
jgi:hypothetical protein